MPVHADLRHATLVAAGRTDVGRVRRHNEDTYLVAALGDDATVTKGAMAELTITGSPALLIVADGVGGAASGEIASLMAADAMLIDLRRQYANGVFRSLEAVTDAIQDAVAAANYVIYTYATGHPQHRGMATTATLAALYEHTLIIAQVGDSRAYVVHDGEARQITKDQSLVQRLLDAGEITAAQAANSERRNIILQALGSEPVVIPDLYRELPHPGDVFILCSDGLSNYVTPEEMARVAAIESDMGGICDRLITLANTRGGHDNITVIAARVAFPDVPAPRVDMAESLTPQASASQGLVARVRRWLR